MGQGGIRRIRESAVLGGELEGRAALAHEHAFVVAEFGVRNVLCRQSRGTEQVERIRLGTGRRGMHHAQRGLAAAQGVGETHGGEPAGEPTADDHDVANLLRHGGK